MVSVWPNYGRVRYWAEEAQIEQKSRTIFCLSQMIENFHANHQFRPEASIENYGTNCLNERIFRSHTRQLKSRLPLEGLCQQASVGSKCSKETKLVNKY